MNENDKNAPAKTIIWIDCEMTGLGDDDELLEIAVVPTDMQLNVLDEGIDLIIKPTENGMKLLKENTFVLKMHTSSGLLAELENGNGVADVEQQVLEYIKRFEPKQQRALLGGNSVHSDKKFIDKYMPAVSDHLHYRLIDVSTIKELSKVWYPDEFASSSEKKSNHRALDDIIESINELKYYREAVFK
ncbi:MAG: oligoribonuclease [Candidatus Ancillula sp.]|jgi:oligoribonuclease|nr:oligoribonuclease [Candidatus Ancillula sp.]